MLLISGVPPSAAQTPPTANPDTRQASTLLAGFAASIRARDAAAPGKSLPPATSQATVTKATLLPGDRQVEAVWNLDARSTRPASYRVELFHGSKRVTTQTVCGSCTWALFPGPAVVNGERYRAGITPIGPDDRAGDTVVTGSAQPATLPVSKTSTLPNDDALDRAIEEVGKRPALRESRDEAGLAVSLADGKLVAGFVDNEQYKEHAADLARARSAPLVQVRPMKYSTATLEALSDRIAHEAHKLRSRGIRITATSVNVLANKVTVDVLPATAAMANVLAAEYGSDTLILRGNRARTRQSSNNPEWQPAPRIPSSFDISYYGGIWVSGASGDCTAGYVAKKENGELYLTTAGHCYTVGTPVSDGAGSPIGRVTEALDGKGDEADGALVSIDSPEWATNQKPPASCPRTCSTERAKVGCPRRPRNDHAERLPASAPLTRSYWRSSRSAGIAAT
ncbi:chymotrypsin family serine protease [Actinomadura soli]|uniref:hypothetical protein n=1 Tax=Actinomadura soli TaxID=2508997 RepID=UPI00197B06A5|nr:hypothetical protein [Actinomadura soli]